MVAVASLAETLSSLVERAAPGGRPDVLVGLVGRGIGSSRSPRMHEREGARLGLRTTYVLIDFDAHGWHDDALPDVLRAATDLGFAGLNVTHPFKQTIIAHLDMLAPEAAAISAVNTVVFQGGRSIGYNTDCWGFAQSLASGLPDAALDRVVLFGAGGAGAAVGHALLEVGTLDLQVYDPDRDRASKLARRLGDSFGRPVTAAEDVDDALRGATGAVNATPIGMEKYPGLPFEVDTIDAGQWVADIVYFPAETELLRRARARGCRTLAGTGMAIFQAIKAFEFFTGREADLEAMRRHFEGAA